MHILTGTCNVTCASITTDMKNTSAAYLIGSTITLHLMLEPYLSALVEGGGFVLYKDEAALMRSNVNLTSLGSGSVMYHLYDAQPTDSGVYYAEHISTHAVLFTNRLFINISDLNPSSTTSQPHTSKISSKLLIFISSIAIVFVHNYI